MARFIREYYNDETVAANDIGALAFYTNANVLDLWGLANQKVAKSRKDGYWTPQFLDSLCKNDGATVAIIYDSWFSDSLTSRWQKVGTWQIQNNIICGDDVVSFYSLDQNQAAVLRNNLKKYEERLPASVVVNYY
jgi:hypothetical protein